MLLIVCVSAFVPFVWVIGVVVGVFGVWWCVFQWWVAVVWASRRVPGVVLGFGVWVGCLGVVWLVSGVGGLVWVCFGVGWLVSGVGGVCGGVVWLVLVGVWWLVCVLWWFRMLTCLASFFLLVLSFVLSCCLVNNGLPGCVGAGGCLLVGCLGWCGCVLCVFWGWLVVGCVFLCLWAGGCVLWMGESVFVCFLWVIGLLLLVCWSRVVCVWGYWLLFCL